MQSTRLVLLSLVAAISAASAQDPSFRAPVNRTTAPAPAPAPSSGDVVNSAGLINTMDVLDNTRPIRPGDLLGFRVLEDKNQAIQIPVSVTGEIPAPYIGVVRAAGRTCRELAFSIKDSLEKSMFNKATVIVTIDRTPEDRLGNKRYDQPLEVFTVFGQVIRQGRYELPLDEDMTISQAVLMAGGFAQFANPKKVKLVRQTPSGQKTILVNLDRIMRKGDLQRDLYLRPNDVIIIDEKTVNF